MHIDILLLPHWIVPVEPHNIFLTDHAIAINQGKIVAILPQEQAQQQYQAKETIALDQHVVMPGLVNSHTHSPMTLLRGYADDLALMEWLKNYVWPIENRWVGPEFIHDGMQLAMAEMLRGGTTCLPHPLVVIQLWRASRFQRYCWQ